MATATADDHRARPGLHVLTTQQRYTLRSLVAIVSLHDHWRRRAEALER